MALAPITITKCPICRVQKRKHTLLTVNNLHYWCNVCGHMDFIDVKEKTYHLMNRVKRNRKIKIT